MYISETEIFNISLKRINVSNDKSTSKTTVIKPKKIK